MKIIKPGKPEVLATVNQRFICSHCKCEFIANWDEYEEDIKVSLMDGIAMALKGEISA